MAIGFDVIKKEQTINAYAELVKKNIDFDVLLHTYSREQDR